MKDVQINISECRGGGAPNGSWGAPASADKLAIISGRASGGSVSSSLTKIKFVTPPFISKTRKTNIKVNVGTLEHKGTVQMSLSKTDFSTPVEVVGAGYSANGATAEFRKTSLGSVIRKGDQKQFLLSGLYLEPNTTYFLYFYRYSDAGSSTEYFIGRTVSLILQCADLYSLPSPAITSAYTVIVPQNFAYVYWSWSLGTAADTQTPNSLQKYRIYLKIGAEPTTSSYDAVYESTSTSVKRYKLPVNTYARGDDIYIGVQAISVYNDYKNSANATSSEKNYLSGCNSALSKAKKILRINSLPNKPILTANGSVIGGNQTLTITTTPGADNEVTLGNQTASVYYKLGNSSFIKVSNNQITLSLDDLTKVGIVDTGYYTLTAKTYDGLEYSEVSSFKIKAEFAPIILEDSKQVISTLVLDGEGNKSVLEKLDLKFKLKYDFTSGLTSEVYIGDNANPINWELLDSSYYSFLISEQTKTISINTTKIPESLVKCGEKFAIKYKISNAGGSSAETEVNETYMIKPLKVSAVSIPVIVNDAKEQSEKWEDKFKEKITITYDTPSAEAYQPDIFSIKFIVINETNGEVKKIEIGKDEGTTIQKAIDLSWVTPGNTLTFAIEITDITDQTSLSSETGKYTKIKSLTFVDGVTDALPKPYNPHTSNGFQVSHPFAKVENDSDITVSYEYICEINNSSFIYEVAELKEQEASLIAIAKETFSNNIIEKTKNIPNFNGKATIKVIATDAFGQETELPITFNVNRITAPSFGSVGNFVLLHDYNIKGQLEEISNLVEVVEGDKDSQIFNAREGIVFKIPAPEDPNDDVENFEVSIYRFKDSDFSNYEDKIQLTISKDSCKENGNYYYYRYPASSYTENKFFRFEIIAKDSQSNKSGLIESNTYIIGARTVSPTVDITDLKTELNNGNVDLNFKLSITDLGGSAVNSWDQAYYSNYPNFDRKVSGVSIAKRQVKIEISPVQDFSQNNEFKKTINLDSINLDDEYIFEYSVSHTFKGYPKTFVRVYIRIIFEVSPGLEGDEPYFLSSIPFSHVHFGEAPTVAHRAHRVGINTKTFKEEDVLVIESYGQYKKIILRSGEQEIAINLEDGSITGATAITLENGTITGATAITLENGTITGATINCGGW